MNQARWWFLANEHVTQNPQHEGEESAVTASLTFTDAFMGCLPEPNQEGDLSPGFVIKESDLASLSAAKRNSNLESGKIAHDVFAIRGHGVEEPIVLPGIEDHVAQSVNQHKEEDETAQHHQTRSPDMEIDMEIVMLNGVAPIQSGVLNPHGSSGNSTNLFPLPLALAQHLRTAGSEKSLSRSTKGRSVKLPEAGLEGNDDDAAEHAADLVRLCLDIDSTVAGEEGTPTREMFSRIICHDLSNASGLPGMYICMHEYIYTYLAVYMHACMHIEIVCVCVSGIHTP